MIWFIGLGGALGAAARYSLGIFINGRASSLFGFPFGTLLINISGSFLLGVLANLHVADKISEPLWLFAGVGFCGAYTTFSTFGYETVTLLEAKQYNMAILYVASSLIISIIVAAIGLVL